MVDILNEPISQTPQVDQSWIEGLDAETVGFLQNRGYDKLPAKEAAVEAVKAYRNAQKMMGAPPESLLRIPHADNLEEQQQFWRRLGAPEKPGDYDFAVGEWEDAEKTSRFTEALRSAATEMNMPKPMAERMARAVMEWANKETSDGESQLAAHRTVEERELYQSWGQPNSPTFRANNFLVDRAMETLGIDQPTADSLRESIGLKRFSEIMHRVGTALGEDKFVTTDSAGTAPRGPMTREQMMGRLDDLKSDRDWTAKLLKGDRDAKREFDDLTKAIRGL